METPSSSGSEMYQESETTEGALLIPIIYFSDKLKDAHASYGIRYEYELQRDGQSRLNAIWYSSSPYYQALNDIYRSEVAGELETGSAYEASAALFNGTFDESDWVTFLPQESEE